MSALRYTTCTQCGVEVQFPANFCDMCGSALAAGVPASREALTRPSNHGVPLNGDGDSRADSPIADGVQPLDDTGMSAVQDALRRAYFLLKAAEKDLEGFRSNMLEMEQSLDPSLRQNKVSQAFLEDLTLDITAPRQSETFRRNLELALQEIETVRRQGGDAVLEIEARRVSAKTLTGMVDRAWGDLSLSAGRIPDAITRYQRSVTESESPDTFFALGIAYECADQPGRALQAFDRCGKLAPRAEVGIEARKCVGRLRSKMLMGGWFVGSWKGFLILLSLASLGLLGSLFDGRLIPAAALCGIVSAIYWRSRFRR